jgi:signal transduction histidine kinase
VEEAHRRVFETGGTEMFDVQTRIHAGRPVAWFRCRVGPLYRNGRIANLIVMATDITEQKRAEEALNNSLVRMRQLAARLESAREEERKRIALDIHDRLGQALTGLKLDLASLASRLSGDREGRRRLRCTSRSLDDTIQTVREISTELRPAILDSLGLKAAIEWQAREYQSRSKLRFRLDLSADDDTLNPDLSAALFRTFQEILTNVARHARARRVNVSLSSGPNRLTLTVADDGKGISQKALSDPSSLGLLGMRERALAFGGTVDFRGRRGRGTTVAVSVPRSLKTNRKKSP